MPSSKAQATTRVKADLKASSSKKEAPNILQAAGTPEAPRTLKRSLAVPLPVLQPHIKRIDEAVRLEIIGKLIDEADRAVQWASDEEGFIQQLSEGTSTERLNSILSTNGVSNWAQRSKTAKISCLIELITKAEGE